MVKNEFDLREIISKYLKQWKWFLLTVFLTLSGAYIYLRYSIPKYQVSAKIQIVEESNSGSELNFLKDLNVLSEDGNTEIIDEIELLKSRDNFIKIVKKLKLNIRYNVLGNVTDAELYKDYPFIINFLSPDSVLNESSHTFFVSVLNENEFEYKLENEKRGKKVSFGSSIRTDAIGSLIIVPDTEKIKRAIGKEYKISIAPLFDVASSYKSKVFVSPADKRSKILNISMTDAIPQRAIDILNSLIAQNNQNEVLDKKAIADRTSEFIEDRISEIYSNLSSVDDSAEDFKERRGIADLGSQSSVNLQRSAESEQALQNASVQLSIASSMQNLIQNQDGYEIIPTNVGLADTNIDNAASKYNDLVAQRNRLLESSNEKNPVIVKLDQQLESIKTSMQSSLNNVTNNLNLRVNSLSKQLSQINSRIYATPGNERALRDISRKQQTTESLYLYLLQKREEAQISFASAAPKSKIVDNAYLASSFPVEPKNKIIYLLSLLVGLFVPFIVIYLLDLFDNKVKNLVTLQKLVGSGHNVLAEIPIIKNKEELIVQKKDRSILSESLRILRTNLDYILKVRNKENRANRVLITSSVSGEGKTFISSNLALIFASTGKKVLLLGADIRNPKIFNFFSNKSRKNNVGFGLTEYLSGQKLEPKDLINKLTISECDIDVIYSGDIPPNPAELLLGDRIKELVNDLSSKYDYIIIDSAPLLAVTDTLLLESFADQIIYVTKSGVTEKRVIEYPINLYKEGKIKSLAFIVNGVKESNLGYGGKYGYGYGVKKKRWWNFAKR